MVYDNGNLITMGKYLVHFVAKSLKYDGDLVFFIDKQQGTDIVLVYYRND